MPVSTPAGRWTPSWLPSVESFESAHAPSANWALFGEAAEDMEKRQCPRRSLRCPMVLIAHPADDETAAPAIVPAECLDICDGGLYCIANLCYGLAAGQRYTIRLIVGERGPEPGSRQVVQQEGEIVRTELMVGEHGELDRVGVAVRLFGRRNGLVPMPTRA